jgi:hypothetical protein
MSIRKANRKYRRDRLVNAWREEGSPLPPPHAVKQSAIDEYRRKYGTRTLVETGTYLGDMVMAQLDNFDRIYSIELGMDLWEQARKKFEPYRHVEILQGDSGQVLVKLIPRLDQPALFWLDGHYSAGVTAKGEKVSPVFEELDAIFGSSIHSHVLMIDDARLFKGDGDYPSVSELQQHVQARNPRYQMEIRDDIIRFTI